MFLQWAIVEMRRIFSNKINLKRIWSNKGENLNTQSICASKYTAMVLFDILLAANKASL